LVQATLRPGDLLLTMGAGDIWQVGEAILARLKSEI
jgi:UDP-N-acetylmuramate-alanine ligase